MPGKPGPINVVPRLGMGWAQCGSVLSFKVLFFGGEGGVNVCKQPRADSWGGAIMGSMISMSNQNCSLMWERY